MEVRVSASFIAAHATHVSIDHDALATLVEELRARGVVGWNECEFHYTGAKKLEFVFAIDALNFCFWGQPGFEYEDLANGLKALLEEDESALDAEKLAEFSSESLEKVFKTQDFPLFTERLRLLREVGRQTIKLYGSYEALVEAAGRSALKLVELITASFPGFRDSCVYKGHQVFFYKRAQILTADLWGAYKGEGIGQFDDINSLTMFPDYRVPQILQARGVLKYSEALNHTISSRQEILAGSHEEVEIRGLTVQACELIAEKLSTHAIIVDWQLWQAGEEARSTLPPHHLTRTVFY